MRTLTTAVAVLALATFATLPAGRAHAAETARPQLIPSIRVTTLPGWASEIVPRMAPDANSDSTLDLPDTLLSDRPTWFNYSSSKNAAFCGTWTDALGLGSAIIDSVVISNCEWAAMNFMHLNRGPAIMRGGRHTLIAYADLHYQVATDYDFRSWPVPNQFTWSPEPLPAGAVTTSPTPPPPTTDNNGYQFDRATATAFVVSGVTDQATDDIVLRIYTDPWHGSTSGYLSEGAGSARGPGQVNFVVGSADGTPATIYPAVSAWTQGATGGYSLSWSDAAGRRDANAASRWAGTLGASRMAAVYEVWLRAGVPFRAALARTSGADDLALAIGPPGPGTYWSRSTALATSLPVAGDVSDSLACTPSATGWHPLVVFRSGSADRSHAQGYVLQTGASTTGVGDGGARLFLAVAGANPVAAPVRIAFGLPRAGTARLVVLDAQGRRVRTLADGSLPAGPGDAGWDLRDDRGSRVRSGLYWVQLDCSAGQRASRMVVTR
jgi:hypothetical protein